jgi:hypothetical protein
LRKELGALETQKQSILGNHAGRSMNRLPIYEMASSQRVVEINQRVVNFDHPERPVGVLRHGLRQPG